jgi:hypothetical protein
MHVRVDETRQQERPVVINLDGIGVLGGQFSPSTAPTYDAVVVHD